MKKILILSLLCIGYFAANAQYLKPNNSFGTIFNRVAIDSTLHFPTGCGTPSDSTFLRESGIKNHINTAALYYDSCGHAGWLWDPSSKAWLPIGTGSGSGGGVDTIYQRNDSAFYIKKNTEYFAFKFVHDTSNLSLRIDTTGTRTAPFTATTKGIVNPNGSSVANKALGTDNSFITIVVPADTVAKWIGYIKRSNDSIFYCKSTNTCTFVYKSVINYSGVPLWGYGTYATRPATGTGLYIVTDSSFRVAYVNGGVVQWITDAAGKLYNVTYTNTGSGYPLVSATDTNVNVKRLVPGTNIAFDTTTTPGSIILNASGGSGGSDTTILPKGAGLHQEYPGGPIKYLAVDTATDTTIGSITANEKQILERRLIFDTATGSGHAPIHSIVGTKVDTVRSTPIEITGPDVIDNSNNLHISFAIPHALHPSDTTYLHNLTASKLNITDTANLHNLAASKVDSTGIGFQQSITNKRTLSKSDSIMLNSWRLKFGGYPVVYVGDTTRLIADTSIFLGDSWMVGYYANPELPTASIKAPINGFPKGFANLYARYIGTVGVDLGISGATASSALTTQLQQVPIYSTNMRVIVLMFGINDMANGVASYRLNYKALIDSVHNRGWPYNKMFIMAPGWTTVADSATRRVFADTAISLANLYGIPHMNTYKLMYNNGRGLLMHTDSLHPNATGHFTLFTGAIDSTSFESGNLLVQGNIGVNVNHPRASLHVNGDGFFVRDVWIDSVHIGRANCSGCTAVGGGALLLNAGTSNSALGFNSLWNNSTGSRNTGTGFWTLQANTTGNDNTANGFQALVSATTASNNTAIGSGALGSVTTGPSNVGIGKNAGGALTTGLQNTFVGESSCQSCVLVNQVTAIGSGAGNGFSGTVGAKVFISTANTSHLLTADMINGYVNIGQLGSVSGTTITNLGGKNINLKGSVWLGDSTTLAIAHQATNGDSGYFKHNGAVGIANLAFPNSVAGTWTTGQLSFGLKNDNAAPGNSMYYGTNSSGTFGYFALPSGGSTPPFADNTAIAKNNADNTKLFKFDLSAITTGQTRTGTIPDFATFTFAAKDQGQAWSGSQDMTGATLQVNSQSAKDSSLKAANTKYVDQAVAAGLATITSIDEAAYVPTATSVTNVALVTSDSATWTRNGNTVTVFGRVYITPNSITTTTSITLSIPINSNIINSHIVSGLAGTQDNIVTGTSVNGVIRASSTANTVLLQFLSPTSNGVDVFYYSYRYRIQ